jgi:hypothetical protein
MTPARNQTLAPTTIGHRRLAADASRLGIEKRAQAIL